MEAEKQARMAINNPENGFFGGVTYSRGWFGGNTLLELLVVIAIISMLMAVASPVFVKVRDYTPTHCQDKKPGFLRWTHRRILPPLERRESVGQPECQRLRRTPRLGCDTPMPGETADYYKTQNTGQDHILPHLPSDSPADRPPQPLLAVSIFSLSFRGEAENQRWSLV
jgi:hypothetical protein